MKKGISMLAGIVFAFLIVFATKSFFYSKPNYKNRKPSMISKSDAYGLATLDDRELCVYDTRLSSKAQGLEIYYFLPCKWATFSGNDTIQTTVKQFVYYLNDSLGVGMALEIVENDPLVIVGNRVLDSTKFDKIIMDIIKDDLIEGSGFKMEAIKKVSLDTIRAYEAEVNMMEGGSGFFIQSLRLYILYKKYIISETYSVVSTNKKLATSEFRNREDSFRLWARRIQIKK